MTGRAFAGGLVVALVLGGILGVVLDDALGQQRSDLEGIGATPAPAPNRTVTVSPLGNGSYTSLYEGAIDSVVSLHVQQAGGRSQGSGFVYDGNGHIVTNQHVVGSVKEVEIRFSDGQWRRGRVIGTDVYTDLAVVHVENLPDDADPLPVAANDPIRGEPVAALGNPLGLEGSITSGIVSGLNRSMRTGTGFTIPDTIQTDAAVNPGNSGGPLLTLDGRVVGVNRAKQGDNIGFAISPALIHRVVPELIRSGGVEHPYMGITSIDVSPTVARVNGLDRPRGVLIVEVPADGPARGHIQPSDDERLVNGRRVPVGGDVIVAIDGQPIDSQEQLAAHLMRETRPDERIDVTVLRDGSRETVSFRLDARPPP